MKCKNFEECLQFCPGFRESVALALEESRNLLVLLLVLAGVLVS